MIDTKSLQIINAAKLVPPNRTLYPIYYFDWNDSEPLYIAIWKRYIIMVEVIFDSKKYGYQYWYSTK